MPRFLNIVFEMYKRKKRLLKAVGFLRCPINDFTKPSLFSNFTEGKKQSVLKNDYVFTDGRFSLKIDGFGLSFSTLFDVI